MIRPLLLYALLAYSGLSAAKVEGGQQAPDFLGKNAKTGAEVKLADFADKIVVLHFWASWQGGCPKRRLRRLSLPSPWPSFPP